MLPISEDSTQPYQWSKEFEANLGATNGAVVSNSKDIAVLQQAVKDIKAYQTTQDAQLQNYVKWGDKMRVHNVSDGSCLFYDHDDSQRVKSLPACNATSDEWTTQKLP